MLGDAEQLNAEYMLVEDVNVANLEELLTCPSLSVRIRYRSRAIPVVSLRLTTIVCW